MEPYRHETMMMADYDIVSDIIDTMMDIYDEYDGAKKYIKEAFALKEKDPNRANELVQMSAQELGHGGTLTNTVGKMLEKARSEENPCYATLAMVWLRIRQRQDGYAAWIKQLHDQYKK